MVAWQGAAEGQTCLRRLDAPLWFLGAPGEAQAPLSARCSLPRACATLCETALRSCPQAVPTCFPGWQDRRPSRSGKRVVHLAWLPGHAPWPNLLCPAAQEPRTLLSGGNHLEAVAVNRL